MNLAPLTLDGWYILHQFFRLTPPPLSVAEAGAEDEPGADLAALFADWEDLGEDGWSGLYRLVGGGADYMAVHFRPSLEALAETERTLQRHDGARDLALTSDYVSVVELGLYAVTLSLLEQARDAGIEPGSEEWETMARNAMEQQKESAYVRRRLRPRQPDDMPYICFYPMDKRRVPGQNWYTLDLEKRARLMTDHGETGRRYAGRISQVISGSVGFDDWEWAVTLFAAEPLDFKTLVTEMRYDEVSALYAEFGSFLVGYRVPTDRIAAELASG